MSLPFPRPRNHHEEIANARAMDGDYSTGPWKYPPRKPTRSLPEGSGIFVAIIPALALWALIAWVA